MVMGDGEIISGTTASAGRVDKVLADVTDLSRARIQALIAEGAVTLDGSSISAASLKVKADLSFSIHLPPPSDPQANPQDIPIVVVHEDADLIVVDKPAGMVVHPAAGNPDGTLVNALLHHCRGQLSGIGGVARPGIVHRIDKDTSGLLVVAKTDRAHEGLARQFKDHSIERAYLAVTRGHPSPASGTIAGRIGRSDRDRKKMAMLPNDSSRGKHAVTHYKVKQELTRAALVEFRLETGRTHQVRVHAASIGHPLIGDPVYGRSDSALLPLLKRLGFARQALHAATLGFDHPATGQRVHFASQLPPDMGELIDELAR